MMAATITQTTQSEPTFIGRPRGVQSEIGTLIDQPNMLLNRPPRWEPQHDVGGDVCFLTSRCLLFERIVVFGALLREEAYKQFSPQSPKPRATALQIVQVKGDPQNWFGLLDILKRYICSARCFSPEACLAHR